MLAGTRVSFMIGQVRALGTTITAEGDGRISVAVDPNYIQGSQGILRFVIWIPVVSLTVIP